MDTDARVARIAEMEAALDAASAELAAFERSLDAFEGAQGAFAALGAYYGSPEWFLDLEADEAQLLPADLKRGVLSEDAAYNLLMDYHDLALRMLELATRALKN